MTVVKNLPVTTLAQRLEAAIHHAKTTQSAVARVLGVHRQTLTALKYGKIGHERLPEVAKILGVDPTWLVTGRGQAPTWAADISEPAEADTVFYFEVLSRLLKADGEPEESAYFSAYTAMSGEAVLRYAAERGVVLAEDEIRRFQSAHEFARASLAASTAMQSAELRSQALPKDAWDVTLEVFRLAIAVARETQRSLQRITDTFELLLLRQVTGGRLDLTEAESLLRDVTGRKQWNLERMRSEHAIALGFVKPDKP